MPSNEITTQGQAWDQISLKHYGSEKLMGVLLPANVNGEFQINNDVGTLPASIFP